MNPKYSANGGYKNAYYSMEVMDEPLNYTGINWSWWDNTEKPMVGYNNSIYFGPRYYGKVTIINRNGIIEMAGVTTEIEDQEGRPKEVKLPIKGIYDIDRECWKMITYPKSAYAYQNDLKNHGELILKRDKE